jgi:AraC-like DNA-binding protein
MQDHIREHIGDAITLKDLSEAANYSESHSLRIFKELTGSTPFEYIRRYRLTHGAKRLTGGNIRIADVASSAAFDTHEGFTRAFSKEFGLSPEAYKSAPVPLKFFIPYSVLIRHLVYNREDKEMEKKEKQTVFTYVIERPERKLIMKRGVRAKEYFGYCEEAGCDVWGILESIKGTTYEPAGFWLPEKLIRKGTSQYVLGVEVPSGYKGAVPDGFEMIDLDACRLMVFQGEPYDDSDFDQAIKDIWDAIDKFDPSFRGFEWADADAPRFQYMPVGGRGYIEARPIRPLKK